MKFFQSTKFDIAIIVLLTVSISLNIWLIFGTRNITTADLQRNQDYLDLQNQKKQSELTYKFIIKQNELQKDSIIGFHQTQKPKILLKYEKENLNFINSDFSYQFDFWTKFVRQ